jgi:hypothetical protein
MSTMPSRQPRPLSVRRLRRWARARTGTLRSQTALILLVALSTVVGASMVLLPSAISIPTVTVPMVLGSLFLGPRVLPWFIVYLLLWLTAAVPVLPQINGRAVTGVLMLFLTGLIIMMTSFRRTRLGVAGARGESMLVELSDRILSLGELPELPAPWSAEVAIRSSGGTRFAGDFVVAALSDPDRLDLAMVDVSGKGEQAGTRALLLAGAMGGLVSAVDPVDFLPSANAYLAGHPWQDGFATAVQLSLDLQSGVFRVWSAGHPPALHWVAGSGRWLPLASEGPLLGLVPDADFDGVSGTLRTGDALMLYTDGMVETRRGDIGMGIDKMLGQADQLLRGRFEGGAALLADELGSPDDDRALLLVWRR